VTERVEILTRVSAVDDEIGGRAGFEAGETQVGTR